jgi:hypothetical protein
MSEVTNLQHNREVGFVKQLVGLGIVHFYGTG